MVTASDRKKVLTFGELLIRMSPDSESDWLKSNNLPVYVGGAEANVASALAKWEIPTAYFSAVPENVLSRQLVKYLQEKKIDTSPMLFQGDKLGIFYLHQGTDMKNTSVIYDRRNSSFADLKPTDIDWDNFFRDVSWFHFSAICPAITQSAADVCLEAVKIASQKNINVSLDLNYRSKLWQYGREPVDVLPEIAGYCNLIMGNIWAAEKMLGISFKQDITSESSKEVFLAQAEYTSKAIIEKFSKVTAVANTFRFDYKDRGIRYYTTLFANDSSYLSREYFAEEIVDKVGSGDCFMAGLIYGYYKQLPGQQILDFATAAAFKKLFEKGDSTAHNVEEIKGFLENGQ